MTKLLDIIAQAWILIISYGLVLGAVAAIAVFAFKLAVAHPIYVCVIIFAMIMTSWSTARAKAR